MQVATCGRPGGGVKSEVHAYPLSQRRAVRNIARILQANDPPHRLGARKLPPGLVMNVPGRHCIADTVICSEPLLARG